MREDYDKLVEAYALLAEVINANMLPIKVDVPVITGPFSTQVCRSYFEFVRNVHAACILVQSEGRVASFREKFRVGLGKTFLYEFSQGDLVEVQGLINELRGLISESKDLDQNHKQRLLRRLEQLQSELHKKMSDLDRFWGLIGDAGVVLNKLGNDAKPIVDRIREISQITWKTQSRAEELPSNADFPKLEYEAKSTPDIT